MTVSMSSHGYKPLTESLAFIHGYAGKVLMPTCTAQVGKPSSPHNTVLLPGRSSMAPAEFRERLVEQPVLLTLIRRLRSQFRTAPTLGTSTRSPGTGFRFRPGRPHWDTNSSNWRLENRSSASISRPEGL